MPYIPSAAKLTNGFYGTLNKLKEDKWIEHVVIKLRSEGLNRLSYTTEKAISFLQDCVAGQRLIGTLIRNESKVISMLPGEVMQQKLF